MRYRVLGTTRALHDDGTPVPLGGARLRALLTVLALRPGRAVPVGILVAEVWGGDPPADAVGALQALVGRLRRAIGPAAVASSESGYRLCADEEDIDVHRFGRLATEGAQALADGDPAKAAGLFDDALALWQGPALADLPDAGPEAARWETRRLDTRRSRLAAALALGRADQALPELNSLCARLPLDEPLQALRIRALRDVSRTAEALAAYEEVRTELADRLGADPGPELRALHEELLRSGEDPRVSRTPASHPRPSRTPLFSAPVSRPAADRTTAARAPETRYPDPRNPAARNPETLNPETRTPDTHQTTPRGVPADRPQRPVPGNLRTRLTSFVGRKSDIDAIRQDLGRARLVTLLGPGGAGKTRLSQEAAERAADHWPDGLWLAELAPVEDPETVPEAVLTALGARETVLRGAGAEELRAADRLGEDPLVRLAEHCAHRRMLLLLDNCEHLVEAAATLAEELLARCPELTVLATSREPLGVPGEVVRSVEPLPPDHAHRLFAERAAAVRPDFDPADDPEAVAEICRRLDGLPLAIELAAARLRSLGPRQIADRLDDRFALLTSGSRTVLPRQQTLRAVVDWSWDLLEPDEHAVLRRLSVFAGGCDLGAAEAVCADEAGVDSRAVAGLLGSLVDKSLVVAEPAADGDMRYRLLETVAEYTAERLDEAADRAVTERRHLVHYRELARTTDPVLRGPGQRAGIVRLQLEYENLRTALRHAVAARDEQEALSLVLSLAWFWQMVDLRPDARHWAGAAAGLGPDPFAPPTRPVQPIVERCTDAPPPMSAELLEEARREVRLVQIATMDHDADWTSPERLDWLGRVAAVYRPGLPQTSRFPGYLWFFSVIITGDADRLRTIIDEAVRTCEELGYDWELAGALHMRANVLANRTDWDGDAARDADRSLSIYQRIGDAWGIAEALSARGEAREKRGDYEGAAADYAAAVDHVEDLGARGQAAVLRARLAVSMFETGQSEEGELLLRDVLEDGRDVVREALPIARLFLAVRLGRTGRVSEARDQLVQLREIFSSPTLALFDGMAQSVMAWLDCLEHRYPQAVEGVRSALEAARSPLSQMVAPEMAAVALLTAAWALAGAEAGRPEQVREAARLVGAYEALLPDGYFRPTHEREVRENARAAVLETLDEADFEAACAEGAGLSLEEAVALV